jgi:hypothetical protein
MARLVGVGIHATGPRTLAVPPPDRGILDSEGKKRNQSWLIPHCDLSLFCPKLMA